MATSGDCNLAIDICHDRIEDVQVGRRGSAVFKRPDDVVVREGK